MSAPIEVAKVKVNHAGEIYLNKKPVTIEKLGQEFARLKQANGGVWYYLEDPSHPQAKVVEQAIRDTRLPIKLTREKFE